MPEIKFILTAQDRISGAVDRIQSKISRLQSRAERGIRIPTPTEGAPGIRRVGRRRGILSGLGGLGDIGLPFLGGGAGGAAGAGAGSALGALAAVVIVAQGIQKMIAKVVEILLDASPLFKQTVSLLKTGFLLILRPIGDMLAMLLRPIAMFFMGVGKKVMEKTRALIKEGDFFGATVVWIQTIFTELINAIIGAIGEIDWEEIFVKLADWLSRIWLQFVLGIGNTLINIQMWISTTISDALIGFGEWLWNQITGAIGPLSKWLGGFGEWLWNNIIGAIGSIADFIGGLGEWLWNQITGALGTIGSTISGFGEWLWNSITGAIGNLADWLGGLGEWLWNQITGAIGNIADIFENIGGSIESAGGDILGGISDFFGGIANEIGGWFSGIKPMQAGGIVTKPTLSLIGESGPEAVIPLSKAGTLGKNINLNINISDNYFGSQVDFEDTIKRVIDEYLMVRL